MVKESRERRVCNFYGAPTEISAPGNAQELRGVSVML